MVKAVTELIMHVNGDSYWLIFIYVLNRKIEKPYCEAESKPGTDSEALYT